MAGAAARIVPAHGQLTAMTLSQEVTNMEIIGDLDRSCGTEDGTGVTRGVAEVVILPVGHMSGVAV